MLKKGGIELSTSTIIILVILLLVLAIIIFVVISFFGGLGPELMSKMRMALGLWNQSASNLPK